MSANPVGWFEIYVQDITRAKAFYGAVLQRTFEKLNAGDVEESRVVPAGGTIHRSKISIGPYGFVSLVYDTEGNQIGLHSLK